MLPSLPPAPKRRQRATIIWLTAAFGLLLSVWALLTPAFRAPDEISHFSSVERLSTAPAWPDPGEARMSGAVWGAFQERELPTAERSTLGELREESPGLTDELDWMTQHSPLYYATVAVLLSPLDLDSMRWDQALFAARMVSVTMTVPLVWFLWSTVRRLSGSNRAGIVAAVIPFGIPQVQQIGSAVNNDALVILLGAVLSWVAVRILTGDRSWVMAGALGATFGALALTKGIGLAAGALVILILIFGADPHRRGVQRLLYWVTPPVIATVTGLWWFGLNVLKFGTVQPSGTVPHRPDNPWSPGTGPSLIDYVNALWNGFSASFWGKFGALEFPLLEPITDILTVTCLGVLVVMTLRMRTIRRTNLILLSFPAATLLILMYGVWQSYSRIQLLAGIQGRYFFGCLAVVAASSALAWMALIPEHRSRIRFGLGIITVATLMCVYGLTVALMGFFGSGSITSTGSAIRTWVSTSSPLGPLGTGATIALAVIAAGVALWLALTALRASDWARTASPSSDAITQ